MTDANDEKKRTRSLALRTLLRAGLPSMREGTWANKLKLQISKPEYDEFLAGLEGEGLVAVLPGSYGRNRRIALTDAGRAEAIRLVKELAAETYGFVMAADEVGR